LASAGDGLWARAAARRVSRRVETGAVGTEVCVFLPVVQVEDFGDAKPGDEQTLTGNETILVVEDEEPVRNVVTRGLRAHGYNVIEAKHGEDALAEEELSGSATGFLAKPFRIEELCLQVRRLLDHPREPGGD
jgi:FixJ family two-component response regulator